MDTTEFTNLLHSLGGTADQVAATLKNLGIQGVRNTVRFLNPIVRYIQTQIVGLAEADVMRGDTLRMVFHGNRKEEIPLPQTVRDFLTAFNRRAYPDLELPDEKS